MSSLSTRFKLGLLALGFWGSCLGPSALAEPIQVEIAQALDPNPSFRNARDPSQVPTARYARGEDVDLALIIEEWRDRYPQTPVYACACLEQTCGTTTVWPFRRFARYQPAVVLGPTNAASNERRGFNCFDIETGENPT